MTDYIAKIKEVVDNKQLTEDVRRERILTILAEIREASLKNRRKYLDP